MADEDDFLVLTSDEEDDELLVTPKVPPKVEQTKTRRLKRKTPASPPLGKPSHEEDAPLGHVAFSANVFKDDSVAAVVVSESEAQLASDLFLEQCLKDSGLIKKNYQTGIFDPVSADTSATAHRYRERLEQAELEQPDAAETEQLRAVWDAYMQRCETVDESSWQGLLSGSTSNFSMTKTTSSARLFIDDEADEDDDEDDEPKQSTTQNVGMQRSIQSYFTKTIEEVDAYDENDDFCVPDDYVEEDEEEPAIADDPTLMSADELSLFREKKRLKLESEQDQLRLKMEELQALQQEIESHRKKIAGGVSLVERCASLIDKGKQEEI